MSAESSPFYLDSPLGGVSWGEALQTIDLGVIILRVSDRSVVFRNQYAEELALPESDLWELGLPASNETEIGTVKSESNVTRQVVHSGGRTIGLTAYCSNEDTVVVFLKDISEKKAFRDAAAKHDDMGTILTVFSQLRHEIGNPLNSMKMTLQVLKENLDEFPRAKIHAYIGRTVQEIARLEHLLASLRQLSSKEAVPISELDLKLTLNLFTHLVEEECRAFDCQLHVEVEDDARFVMGNPDEISQILHNLLSNAIHAKKENTVNIQIHTARSHNRTIRLDFIDDGVGIPRQCLPLVFRPMFTTKSRGTGIGLALVERLMKRMNGRVEVQSEPGKYTRFELYLPEGRAL